MSLLSKRVGVDEQGQLQGALAILFGLSQLIGPIFFTNVFAWSIGAGRLAASARALAADGRRR